MRDKKNDATYRRLYPWRKRLTAAKQRCTNPNDKSFYWYNKKGIKYCLTFIEGEILWHRDKAYLMKHPTIDRINNEGDYTFDNCQFIENDINAGKDKLKPVLQFDRRGNFIREWSSITEASKALKISITGISLICAGKYKYKVIKGFIFKFKVSVGSLGIT